jgi:peroxiredoxin
VTALAVWLLAATPVAAEPGGPTVGAPLPDVTLVDLDHRSVRPTALEEPVLVLNLFAFWCDTWIAELPQLRELATKQRQLDFRLLSISIDGTWREQLRVVCGEEELPFSVLLDTGGRLSRRLAIRRVPTIIVVDRQRRMTYVNEGFPGNPAILRAVRAAAP